MNKRYKMIPFHVHVMSLKLGRDLTDDEIVHHIDGNKRNNAIENLMVMNRSEHIKLHLAERKEMGVKKCGVRNVFHSREKTPLFPLEQLQPSPEVHTLQEVNRFSKAKMVYLYRPNNLRRQAELYSGSLPKIDGAVQKGKLSYLVVGRITVQIGRKKLTAIWNQHNANGEKEVFRFEGGGYQVSQGIDAKRDEIRKKLDDVLDGLVRHYNLLVGPFVWERKEESIKGDAGIDGLPRDMVLHDTVFKKVYADDLEFVEGKGVSAGYVKNYLNNRALEDLSPKVAAFLQATPLAVLARQVTLIVQTSQTTTHPILPYHTNQAL